MGQVKWTTNNHTKGQFSFKDDDAWWDWKGVIIMSSSRKPINYNKYCFQLDQLKAVCDESIQD